MLVDAVDSAGRPVRRLEAPQTRPAEASKAKPHASVEASTPPEWAFTKAAPERGLIVPLAPSRLAPLEVDAEGDPVEPTRPRRAADAPPAPSPSILANGNRFLRGTLTHALLQHLPGQPIADRESAAAAFVEVRGKDLSPVTRRSIVAETLAVLSHPQFAPVFGPDSRAEVPIVAELEPPGGKGQVVRLTGQIDRLVVSGGEVLIVDFKTNRPPPTHIDHVAEAYLLQLAAYRLAVAQVFPDHRVRAALLWTDGPDLMELPGDRLDDAANRLFLLDSAKLDA